MSVSARRNRVLLFGNGLSVGFNAAHYDLEVLTVAVRERLESLETPDGEPLLLQVDGLVEALAHDHERAVPSSSFESLAGPIDRLANLFTEIGPLADLMGGEAQEQALRELGLTLRVLYKRVVGAVLECVMTHASSVEGWGPLNGMADFVIELARRQGLLDVFILNYDALLDSAY